MTIPFTDIESAKRNRTNIERMRLTEGDDRQTRWGNIEDCIINKQTKVIRKEKPVNLNIPPKPKNNEAIRRYYIANLNTILNDCNNMRNEDVCKKWGMSCRTLAELKQIGAANSES